MILGPLRVLSVWFLRLSMIDLTSSSVRGFTFPYIAWARSFVSLSGASSTLDISMWAAWILISPMSLIGMTCFGLLRFAVFTLVPFLHLTSVPSSRATSSSLVSMNAMRSSSTFASMVRLLILPLRLLSLLLPAPCPRIHVVVWSPPTGHRCSVLLQCFC